MRISLSLLIALILLFTNFSSSFAATFPNFPSCTNPQGTLIVSYDSGIHGVVGGTSYSGSDKVYKLDEESLTQCLCTVDGQGIQTNWWKASSLDETQVNILKNGGWIYVPTGSVWGLDQDSYMAINSKYSCTSSDNIGGSNISNNTTLGQVLGLAFTGNAKYVYSIIILGFLLLIYGQILHRARS